MNQIRKIFILLLVAFICSGARASSFSVEADALSYFLNGFSIISRNSFDQGLDIALGGGRFDLPKFLVESEQDNFDEARWKASCTSILVARIGYRFSKLHESGPVAHFITLHQRWKVQSAPLAGEANFNVISTGVSGGYHWKIYHGFYVYPTAALTLNFTYDGSPQVLNEKYSIPKFGYNGSLHVGYEF